MSPPRPRAASESAAVREMEQLRLRIDGGAREDSAKLGG